MESRRVPVLIAHADWSCDPQKRWVAVSRRVQGIYKLDTPEPAGEIRSLLSRLRQHSDRNGPIIVGFDFPIGLPSSYANRAGISSFLDALQLFGVNSWKNFYNIAEKPGDISLHRPFYPFRSGGTSRRHLMDALGLTSDELLRKCERAHEFRGDACSLFWTLGGKQVGRAAIVGWRDVIVPALKEFTDAVAVWPFHGRLQDLLQHKECIIVETYPAEACLHVGLNPPGKGYSKRSQEGRKSQAAKLLNYIKKRSLLNSNELENEIQDGFGNRKEAEDRFDAFIGLLSMIEVVLGYRPEGPPLASDIQSTEGWIFGQA